MLHAMKFSIFSLLLTVFAQTSMAIDSTDVAKFSEENSALRREHILKQKEVHLKHINDLYDLKLKHQAELDELKKQLKPEDKEGNKALRKQYKEKREVFKKAEKDFQEAFKVNVMKSMNKEYHQSMKQRRKSMKTKGKIKNNADSKTE